MIDTMKLLGVTVVLTVLIWTAADSLVNETALIAVAIEPVPADSDSELLLRLEPPNRSFELQLTGPRRAIEAIQSGTLPRLKVAVPENLKTRIGPASLPVDLESIKRQLSDASREYRRLSLLAIQPPDLPLVVDRRIRKDLAVTAERLTLSYEARPVIQPQKVTVILRESRLAELTASNQMQPIDISVDLERSLRERIPGEPVSVLVQLDSKPYGPDAELIPRAVEVIATLQTARTTAEITAVPIRVATSFSNLQRPVRAVTPDGNPLTLVTQRITVAGPTEDVGKLLRGETRAFGFVHLKDADFEQLGVVRSYMPEFQLPRGLELVGQPESVEFRLVDANDPSLRREG